MKKKCRTCEALDLIESYYQARKLTAKQISDSREILKGVRKKLANSLVRELHRHRPPKPTKKMFRKAAANQLRFSKTSWLNIYDTEYYSA